MADETKQLRELLEDVTRVSVLDSERTDIRDLVWSIERFSEYTYYFICPWCGRSTDCVEDVEGIGDTTREQQYHWLCVPENHYRGCPWRAAREYLETYKDE